MHVLPVPMSIDTQSRFLSLNEPRQTAGVSTATICHSANRGLLQCVSAKLSTTPAARNLPRLNSGLIMFVRKAISSSKLRVSNGEHWVFYVFPFCRAMLALSAAFAVMRCLSVCLSVTFVHSVKTGKRTVTLFHRRVDPSFYFSQTKLEGNSPTGSPPLTGASNTRGYDKITIFDQYIALCIKYCKIEP